MIVLQAVAEAAERDFEAARDNHKAKLAEVAQHRAAVNQADQNLVDAGLRQSAAEKQQKDLRDQQKEAKAKTAQAVIETAAAQTARNSLEPGWQQAESALQETQQTLDAAESRVAAAKTAAGPAPVAAPPQAGPARKPVEPSQVSPSPRPCTALPPHDGGPCLCEHSCSELPVGSHCHAAECINKPSSQAWQRRLSAQSSSRCMWTSPATSWARVVPIMCAVYLGIAGMSGLHQPWSWLSCRRAEGARTNPSTLQ